MNIYDLIIDGKTCRALVMEPSTTQEENQSFHSQFGERLTSVSRVLPPIPDKLPWKRTADGWAFANFTLRKAGDLFCVEWPGGSATVSKGEASKAVRDNWSKGC